jgi:xylulokinase
MTGDVLLGIDVGTQGVKGVLVLPSGRQIAQAVHEHGSSYPRADWVEHDIHDWWLGAQVVIRELLRQAAVDPRQIKSVGVSGLYPAMGPTDARGDPLAGAILYSDNRAVAEVEEVNRVMNLRLSMEELTPKLLWFLRHRPELAAQMHMFFDAAHYLVYQLTGAYVTDTITAGLYGAIYESPLASWRPDVCQRFGIPLEILPHVQPPAAIAGYVHDQASRLTGLALNTPVICGMPDLFASQLSAGVVHTWEAIVYYGTAGVLAVAKDDALNASWLPFPIAEKGGKIQEGYLYDYPVYCLSVGDAVHWFREQLGQPEKQVEAAGGPNAYTALDDLATQAPPGSEGLLFLPYTQGQRSPEFNPWASGVFFGLKAGHTRAHLFRAVLESWGFAIRHGLETSFPPGPDGAPGHPIKRLVATGGGARSPLWRQIVSDITGIAQEHVQEADGPLGAAYIAGLAVGIFKNFEILQKEWVEVSAVTRPDPQVQAQYQKYYAIYAALDADLKKTFQYAHNVLSQ